MSLISSAEMEALAETVIAGMDTPISVLSYQTITVPDGDDRREWVETATTTGWLWEPPDFPTGGNVGGVVGTAHEFRLFLRKEIEVEIGDRIGVEGVIYEVLNTNESNTFQPMLRVSLRRTE